ncbi:MAG: PAS domain S-box protein [Promethearchaeota archaeon]
MKRTIKQNQVEIESKSINKLLQISLDAMNEAVFVIDLKHKILQCNKATLNILGKSNYHDVIGHSCMELLHCTTEPVDWCPVRRMWETGKREVNFQLLNGKWAEMSAEPIYNDKGEITGAVHIIADINARKRAEDALKESKQQYLMILNSLSDAMHVVDEDLRIIFQNPAMNQWLEILNLNPDNIGKPIFEAFPFLDHYKVYNEYSKIFKEKKPLSTIEGTKLFNRIIFTETLKIPIISEGQVKQIITILRDITDRKKFEENLKASEEKYKNIINNLMDIVIVVDLNGNFQYVSPQILEITGFKPEEMIGKNGFKFMHPDDVLNAAEVLREVMNSKEKIHIKYRIIHKDGHYIDVSASGRLVNIAGEERIFVVVKDISDQKRAEHKLKESEKNYRYLIENALEGVWVIDSNAQTTLVNPSMAKILGYSVDEMIGKSVLSFMDSEQAKITKKHLEKRKKGISEERDAIFIHKNGNLVYLRIKATPIFNSNGVYEGTYAFLADITNSKHAEEKLKESEDQFRTITEQSFMGIVILQDGVFKYLNEQTAKINGYTIEEIQNWKPNEFIKIIHPEDREFVMEQARKKQTGDPDVISHYQYRVIKKNGEVIWLENFSKTINYGGKPADFIMTIDISDKIKAEQMLRESEEKYRLISENTDDLIVVYNEDGIIEYLNSDTHSRVLGYNTDQFLEKSFRDKLVHKDDRAIADKSGSEGLEKGNFQYQFRLKHQNGNYIWFEVSGKTFKDHYGNRKILCVSRNINEKKLAEQKIKESKENFRTIAEQAFIGTLIIQDDKVEYVNNALLQIFDYSFEEVVHWKKDDLIKLIYPEDLQYLREYREKLRSGESDIKQYYSYRVFTKYGKIKWIDQYSRPIIYREKSAELVTIMDITEKKKAEEELKKLNSLKSELLRRTSHELKTPLVSIKGFSDLLLTVHKDKLDDYVLAAIHEIKLGCERLENLIQDILKTSELESELVELKKSEEDLSFLIKLCIRELQGLIRLRNHEIHLNIHDKLVTRFEPDQIHLVLSNLLNNAIKYTPPNGKIEIKSAFTDDYVLISIEDNGIGITSEEKKRLFTQFGKIERYGQGLDIISEGSGLGLFITKKIIELHGGTIRVKSKGRNKGSTFYFTLPLIK